MASKFGTLDAFVNNASVRANFSQKQLADYIRQSEALLVNNHQLLDNIIGLLNADENSIAISQVMYVKLSNLTPDTDWSETVQPLLHQVSVFLRLFKVSDIDQYGLDMFFRMCKSYARVLVQRQRPWIGIQPLRSAINSLRKSGELLSIMSSYIHLCILSKNLKPALEMLDVDITEVRKDVSKPEVLDFLTYFYYGGVTYLAAKKYQRAHLFFEITISVPAQAISKVMVEAYKKFTLTSYILYGKQCELPQKSNTNLIRSVRNSTQAYSDLFDIKSGDEFEELRSKFEVLFEEDKNMGLVKQCLTVFYKRNIKKLTKTYVTLSLSDITILAGLPTATDTERCLLEMIQDKEISAKVNQQEGMVYFIEGNSELNGGYLLKQLSQQMQCCIAINAKFKALDEALRTSSHYIKKTITAVDEDTVWRGPNA